MSGKKERGLWELYTKDPEKADAEIWGRKSNSLTRRGFIKTSGLAAMTMAIGSQIPFFRNMPDGFIPLAFAKTNDQKVIEGKDGKTYFIHQTQYYHRNMEVNLTALMVEERPEWPDKNGPKNEIGRAVFLKDDFLDGLRKVKVIDKAS